jgi:hypothetical protein
LGDRSHPRGGGRGSGDVERRSGGHWQMGLEIWGWSGGGDSWRVYDRVYLFIEGRWSCWNAGSGGGGTEGGTAAGGENEAGGWTMETPREVMMGSRDYGLWTDGGGWIRSRPLDFG